MRLQQRQARETGICPVRRELYSQCFGMYNLREHFLLSNKFFQVQSLIFIVCLASCFSKIKI